MCAPERATTQLGVPLRCVCASKRQPMGASRVVETNDEGRVIGRGGRTDMPFTAEVIDRLDLRLSASALTLSEMTDSPSARGGKRERLVASAGERLHRQGVAATTLADIAQAADVPVGNVHYYFRTKDDLVRAVIEAQLDQVEAAGPIRRILEWAEIQIRHLGRRDAAELAITLFAASKAVRCRPAPCAT